MKVCDGIVVTMIRRDPTRIEFTMDDVEVYKMRRENAKAATSSVSNKSNSTGNQTLDAAGKGGGELASTNLPANDARSKSDAIRERIGFDPTPRSS